MVLVNFDSLSEGNLISEYIKLYHHKILVKNIEVSEKKLLSAHDEENAP